MVVQMQGDAIVFRGEKCEHWISPVTSGKRTILQIELSRRCRMHFYMLCEYRYDYYKTHCRYQQKSQQLQQECRSTTVGIGSTSIFPKQADCGTTNNNLDRGMATAVVAVGGVAVDVEQNGTGPATTTVVFTGYIVQGKAYLNSCNTVT
jgi:hypothetical protein